MMRWLSDIIAVLVVASVAGWVGVQYGRQTLGHTSEQSEALPAGAPVRTEPLRSGSIPLDIVAYGQVTPIPGETHVYSVPLESKVESITVIPGQRVGKGDVLMRVSPSPDAALALEQAREEAAYAARALGLANERMSMQLATESEVAQARNAKVRAQGMLENLLSRGVTKPSDIRASEDGIVTRLSWSPGSIVPAGTPLVRVVPIGRIQVVMWVEAEDLGNITAGGVVDLAPVERGSHPQAQGVIRTIAHQVDASTRLVEVTVSLADDGLLLGQYIRGIVRAESPGGLLVSRSALLATPDGLALFVIDKGVAHQIRVGLVAESGGMALVEGDGLIEGAEVVVQGAAGLAEGTQVQVQQ